MINSSAGFFRSILFITLSCAFICTSCSSSGSEFISGEYVFAESFNDAASLSSWKPFRNGLIKKNVSFDGNKFLFLKYSFFTGDDYKKLYGISTGPVLHSCEINLNGRIIYTELSEYAAHLPASRDIVFPDGILQQGNNTLIIKTDSCNLMYTGILSGVRILSETEYEIAVFLNSLIYCHFPSGMAVMCFGLFIAILLYFIFTGRDFFLLFCALALLFLSLIIFALLQPVKIIPCSFSDNLIRFSIPFYTAFLFVIIQSVYSVRFSFANRIIVPFLLIMSLRFFIPCSILSGFILHPVVDLIILFISAVVFIYFIIILHNVNGDSSRLIIISVLMCGTFLLMFSEIITLWMGTGITDFLLISSMPFFIILFTILFAREQMLKYIEQDRLYERLKMNQQRETSITDSAEEKLKRVIEFIEQNYVSTLSREGLAAAVNLNPNYMSSLFLNYTGKKINEFINELRVKDAMKRLKEFDERVIDIALSVGFESLVTFNRAFKKTAGMTPSQYRDSVSD